MISAKLNNYSDLLHELGNLRLFSHIDKVSLSISSNSRCNEKGLFTALKNVGFKCNYDIRKKDPINMPYYKRMGKYSYGKSSILLRYKRKYDAGFRPHLWVVIQDPTKEVLHYLDAVCNSLGFVTKVSQIELALDFFPYKCKLQEFFWEHLFVKRNRGDSLFYGKGIEKSFYSGHKAKNSKTMIIYPKAIYGKRKKILRLELILNRPIIKRLGFDLRLENINNIDLSEFLCFKEWNYHRFDSYLKWKHRFHIAGMSPMSRDLYMRITTEVEFNSLSIRYVMPAISHLRKRGHQQTQRFFNDIPEVNNAFFGLLKKKKFL